MAVKKKKIKNKKALRYFLIAIAVILAALYIGYQAYIIFAPSVKTQTAYLTSEYETIDTQVYVIRQEAEITGSSTGVMVPAVANGSRVAKDDTVARVFADSASAEAYAKSVEIQEEIDRCDSFSNNNAALTDVERLGEEVDSEFLNYLDALDALDYSGACNLAGEFNDTLTQFKIATGETIDFTQKKAELQEELNAINQGIEPISTITASGAGYYVSDTDGYEHSVDYNTATDLTVAKIEELLKSQPAETTANSMGKLIQNFDWYLACVVETEKIVDFEPGDRVEIALPNSVAGNIETVVKSLNNEPDGRTALILQCHQMSEQLATLRIENAQIILKEYSGLKIPSSAIRVGEENERGVYVVKGNIALYKKIDILYSTDDYVIISLDYENNDGVKLYDQVITEGKDVSDGTIIS